MKRRPRFAWILHAVGFLACSPHAASVSRVTEPPPRTAPTPMPRFEASERPDLPVPSASSPIPSGAASHAPPTSPQCPASTVDVYFDQTRRGASNYSVRIKIPAMGIDVEVWKGLDRCVAGSDDGSTLGFVCVRSDPQLQGRILIEGEQLTIEWTLPSTDPDGMGMVFSSANTQRKTARVACGAKLRFHCRPSAIELPSCEPY